MGSCVFLVCAIAALSRYGDGFVGGAGRPVRLAPLRSSDGANDRAAPTPTAADIFLESVCNKGRNCSCVGAGARVLPGGRRLLVDSETSKPMLDETHIAAIDFLGRDGVPLTFSRGDELQILVQQLRTRRDNFRRPSDRGSKASFLPAIIGNPGSGKSHFMIEFTRLGFRALFEPRIDSEVTDSEVAVLGDDCVVSVITFNGEMRTAVTEDSLFCRLAFGALASMGPRDVPIKWGRTDEEAYLNPGVTDPTKEVPLNVWPKCEHMKSADFSTVLESYKRLRREHGVEDPEPDECVNLLLSMYERPNANILILVDELSKAVDTPIAKAAFALSALLSRPNVFEVVTALNALDKAVALQTASNRAVLNVYLGQLSAVAAQALVTECDGALDSEIIDDDVVRAMLTFAAGNPRLIRLVFNFLHTKMQSGRFRDQRRYMWIEFKELSKEVLSDKAPLPLAPTADAVAQLFRVRLSTTPLELPDRVDLWGSPLAELIVRGELVVYRTSNKNTVRLDAYPFRLLEFLERGIEARDELVEARGNKLALGVRDVSRFDAALRLVEMMEDTFIVVPGTTRPLADPSERAACFSVLLGCSRGGRYAVDVLGPTLADELKLVRRRAGISWSSIQFLSREDLEMEADVDALDKSTFYAAVEKRRSNPQLETTLIAVETPVDFRAFDFVLLYRKRVIGFSVKRDPQRWRKPRKLRRQEADADKSFDAVNITGEFRRRDRLRLCVDAYETNENFAANENPPFQITPAAILGFEIDDIRADFEKLTRRPLPDTYAGRENLRDWIPGGLLVFSTLARTLLEPSASK